MELNEIVQQRIDKLNYLRSKGIRVYGSFRGQRSLIGQELERFEEGKKILVNGRITGKRLHGKALFLDIKDQTGKIQAYAKADVVGPENWEILDHVDIADIISVEGELFKTRTGEPTIKIERFDLLTKALRPLPEKWHGLKDVETRYRRRYVDLIANEDVARVFMMRSKIVKAVRRFLDERGFQEVETPMMHAIPGGAAGRPFTTHHNEYDMNLFLRIAPELHLKRLLVGGMEKVYELNRCFRNEGVSTRHNPEFTMLEVYEAYSDYEGMMRLTEDMFCSVARDVLGTTKVSFQGTSIDFAPPWQRRSFAGMVRERFGIEPADDAETMLTKLRAHGLAKDKAKLTRSQINVIIEEMLEKDMSMSPTFVTDYFSSFCPLAKASKENPAVAERFELYVAGMEIANAYSELNDPLEQRLRLEAELKDADPADRKCVDEDFVMALEHGMPPAGGLGVGIDRLTMLFLDQPSIRDVILFPLLRDEEGRDDAAGEETPRA